MLRLLLAAVIGMFATSVVLTATDIDSGHWAWLPITGTAMTLLLILVSLGRAFGGRAGAPIKDIEAADREGRVFLAKILDVRATGSSVNDQPLCEIRLLAQPRNRAAYQTTTRSLVNLGRLPSMQRGAIVVVAQPDAERPELTLLDPAPSHWQRLAETDGRLRAMESAPEWAATPTRGRDSNGLLKIPAVLLILAFVVGAGIRVWPVRDSATAVVQGESIEDVRTAAEETEAAAQSIFQATKTQQVIDDLVQTSGVTQSTMIVLYRTYAVTDLLTTPGAQTTDSWIWRDDTAENQGAELIQSDPEDLPGELFDLTTVDWSLIESLVSQLPTLTGIDNPEPSVYVRRATTDAVTTEVEIALSTSNDYYDAWITADATGTVVDMSGGTPDSQSAAWEAANG